MGTWFQSCGKICSGQPSAGSKLVTPLPSADQKSGKYEVYIPEAGDDDKELESGDWDGRVKGTPIMDESFICMGSMAPRCPTPPRQTRASTGPINLDVLQGSWVGSSGSQIYVLGTVVRLNGVELKAHRVEMWEDGTVRSVGKLWQLEGWDKDKNGSIAWRASSTRENMESARSETWTPKVNLDDEWTQKMKLLGYAGSAADPHNRGVEGCCPGTLGAELEGTQFGAQKDKDDCWLLSAMIQQWREPEASKILPRQVCPDFTNRAETGLGVELIHFIATSMKQKGFQKREGKQGHDIPVVVRQLPGSDFYDEAITLWKERTAQESGFPRVRIGDNEEYFSSLGNGHFFQALNCFDTSMDNINFSHIRYRVDGDAGLAEALSEGVPSLVLKASTPKPVRAKVAQLLNSKRDFHWSLSEDGSVDTKSMYSREEDKVSQFEWLSKGMDAQQVDCLVRQHLCIRDSHRIQG